MSAEYELLLEWTSEHGSGSWDQFRRVTDWLFASSGGTSRTKPGTAAAALRSLGHLEVDWNGGRWATAPPVLTVLPSAGAHATLVGCRTRYLKRRLQECDANIYVSFLPQLTAPDAVFIATSDEREVMRIADYLGVHFEFSVATRLSSLLPSFGRHMALASHSVPTRGFGVKRLKAATLEWQEVQDDLPAGLYKYEAYGRPEFRFVETAGKYLYVDMALGIYAELHRVGRNVLTYQEDALNGTLIVPARAPLPWLQARCAALCSALEPSLDRGSWSRRYVNVPREIADRIAWSLDQAMTVHELPEKRNGEVPHRKPQHIRFSE